MAHPLVLALYSTDAAAAAGARDLHALGIGRDQVSVVARSHQEEGRLADRMDATPGADLEDSRPAAIFGELGGVILAGLALAMPGIGPIVAAGPLSADLGEAAGHAAGSVSSVLAAAGLSEEKAAALQQEVEAGSVLLGVHVRDGQVSQVRAALAAAGAMSVDTANWEEA